MTATARSVPTPADCCRARGLLRALRQGRPRHVGGQWPESAVWGKQAHDATVPVVKGSDDIGAESRASTAFIPLDGPVVL